MTNDFFILYGTKDKETYYISNTNPVIWNSDIKLSKKYYTKYSAELDILRNYDNYKSISSLIENFKLDALYVAIIDGTSIEYNEKGRVKLL